MQLTHFQYHLIAKLSLLVLIFTVGCKSSDKSTETAPVNSSINLSSIELAKTIANDNSNSETKILSSDKAWEANGLVYFSVYQKGARVLLYYLCDDAAKVRHLCYAYSDDGINFIKPNLGQVSFNGSTDNNIISVDLDQMSFFFDSSTPDTPYKIFGMKLSDHQLYIASSKDGISFTTNDQPVVDYYCDTQNQVIYDPLQKKYKFYLRNYGYDTTIAKPFQKSFYYRQVCYFESDNISEIKISPTAIHHPNSKTLYSISTEFPVILDYSRSVSESDIYKPSIIRYADNVYLSYASVFHHYPPPPTGKFNGDGYNSVSLYTSSNGKDFTLYRENFINNEPNSYYLAPGSVYKNGVLFTYYWKVYTTHGNPQRVSDFVVRQYQIKK